MKKLIFLAPVLALASQPSWAAGIGSIPDFDNDDSRFSLDVGYYYQRSNWEGLDNDLADDAMEKITRDAPYLRLNYRLTPVWYVSAIYGDENIANDPDQDFLKIDNSLRDTFVGMQVLGQLHHSDDMDAGVFLQYTSHADYSITGSFRETTLSPFISYDIRIKKLEDILAGVIVQKAYAKHSVYGGIFYQDSSADVSGEVNTAPIDDEIEVDTNIGGMLGVNLEVSNRWNLNLEYQNRGDHGVDLFVTYYFGKSGS